MPAMPGSALVVIETKLVLRSLKAVLDRPPMAFDRHQRFDGRCRWTPGGEEGEIAIGDTTSLIPPPASPHTIDDPMAKILHAGTPENQG